MFPDPLEAPPSGRAQIKKPLKTKGLRALFAMRPNMAADLLRLN
jgi:hypothetical protein